MPLSGLVLFRINLISARQTVVNREGQRMRGERGGSGRLKDKSHWMRMTTNLGDHSTYEIIRSYHAFETLNKFNVLISELSITWERGG